MAVQTGNASSHVDLLNKLKIFICDTMTPSGDRWIVQRYTTTAGSEELIIKGVGYGGTDQIYIGLKAYHDVIADNFALIINGFTGYNSLLPFYNQPGAMTLAELPPCLPSLSSSPVNSTAIKYWFIADPARFMVITRLGTTYHQAYGGFFLTYGTPPQYPFPLCAGGSGVVNGSGVPIKQNDVTNATHAFWKPIDAFNGTSYNSHVSSLAIKDPGGAWRRPYMTSNGTSLGSSYTGTFPYCEDTRSYLGGILNLRNNLDGSYAMQSVVIVDGNPANMYGEFTGMKHLSGYNLNPEDVVQYAGDDYLIIPNVFRTADSDIVAYQLI